MKSEIAWLMEAFLEEDPKHVRVMIKNRMAEVTESLTVVTQPRPHLTQHITQDPVLSTQPPSMQRIMQQHPDLIPKVPPPSTPAAAQALAAREAAMTNAGKQPKNRAFKA